MNVVPRATKTLLGRIVIDIFVPDAGAPVHADDEALEKYVRHVEDVESAIGLLLTGDALNEVAVLRKLTPGLEIRVNGVVQ